jgi:integrase
LSAALEYAAKEGYRSEFLGDISRPITKNMKHEIEILSKKEQKVLESHIVSDSDNRKLGIMLSLYMGLRIGEVCGLKWEDVNFDEKTIHIRHTIERIANVGHNNGERKTNLTVCDAKTLSSNRIIPIPTIVFPYLSQYKSSKGYVVPGNTYDYSDPRTFQNAFHKCLDECHLRSINYHALRHTFATRCIEAGVDIKSLSELLGHASVNITLNIYVHSSLEHKRNQLERLSSVMGQ